jgi:diguanylate cyclase (GGDEF)-like protein
MPPPTEPRIAVVIRYVAWVGIVAHAGFIPLFAQLGQPHLALFNVVSVAAWIAAFFFNRAGRSTLAMWLLTAEVVTHAVLAVLALGWSSGFQHYLIPLIPFVMFNDRLRRPVVLGATAALLALYAGLQHVAPADSDYAFRSAIRAVNVVTPFLALGLVSYYFRLASMAVERQMQEMALTDPLTGLFNRRHMNQHLAEKCARFNERQEPFCVALADVDHFKQINDAHGHAIGDRVLAHVADFLREALRGQDVVARWGGEEFLVLLPETGIDAAAEVANRLRTAAEARLGDIPGLDAGVTLTLGVAEYRSEKSGLETCLKAADEALYEGKSAGRNRVVVAARHRRSQSAN